MDDSMICEEWNNSWLLFLLIAYWFAWLVGWLVDDDGCDCGCL